MGGTTVISLSPALLQSGTYSAQYVRQLATAVAGEGILTSGSFALAQRGAGSNLSVDISAGSALIQGDAVSNQGLYYVRETATANCTTSTADPSNPRIDAIICEIKDDAHDGSTLNRAQFRAVDGTPTGGATLTNLSGAPAIPSSALLLGYTLTAAAASTLTFTDYRHNVPTPGRELSSGSSETTADFTSASLTNGTRSSAATNALTVIGDGVTPVYIEFWGANIFSSAAGIFDVELWDGTIGSGTQVSYAEYISTSTNGVGAIVLRRRYAAWSGPKTFSVAIRNRDASSRTFTLQMNANYPGLLTAKWAG